MPCFRQVSKESGRVVERLEEDNYMFRLTEFKDPLLQWLKTGGNLFTSHNMRVNVFELVDVYKRVTLK